MEIIPGCPTGTMVRDGHLGLKPSCWYNGIIPGCPTGTMVQDGHLGVKPLLLVRSDYPTCTKRYNGTGWTLGIEPLWLVQWDYPGMSHLYQMVRDLGLNPSGWYNGIIPGCSTCTKWYNGTGWTLGIKPLWLVQWDYPGMFYLYQMVQWYGMDTWD